MSLVGAVVSFVFAQLPLLSPAPVGETVTNAAATRATAEVPWTGEDNAPRAIGEPTTLFVNFDGAVLRSGCGNDASLDCSTLAHLFDDYVGPYTAPLFRKAAILDSVRSDVADLGITVTGVRPEQPGYSMVLYGDLGPQSFAGVAPYIDCADEWPGDTSFSQGFTSANTGSTVILQEAGHTWGLEHVNGKEDIMHPIAEGAAPTFRDECLKIVSNTDLDHTPGVCNRMHERFCDSGTQDSFRELRYLFGPRVPDVIAPRLNVVAPEVDAMRESPAVIEVRAEIEDEHHPQWYEVEVLLGEDVVFAELFFGDFGFPLQVPEPGEWEFTLRITDEGGNSDEAPIKFTITEPGALEPAPAASCSVRSRPEGGGAGLAWLFVVAGLRSRRGRSRA